MGSEITHNVESAVSDAVVAGVGELQDDPPENVPRILC